MDHLHKVRNDVDILTIGPYLQPSRKPFKGSKYYYAFRVCKLRKWQWMTGLNIGRWTFSYVVHIMQDEQVNEAS